MLNTPFATALSHIAQALFLCSVQACIIISFLFLLRRFLKRMHAPSNLLTILWCIPLFRLLCPWNIPLPTLATFKTLPTWFANPSTTTIAANSTAIIQQVPLAITQFPNTLLPATTTAGILSDKTVTDTVQSLLWHDINFLVQTLTGIWALGVLIIALRAWIQYCTLQHRVATAYLTKTAGTHAPYYTNETVTSPFVLGICKPRIYLPTALCEKEETFIYLHERTHILRGDYLLKPLFFIAACLHWYNPFVLLALRTFVQDMESACDEAVVQQLGASIKPDYCESLLRFAQFPVAGVPLAFGKHPLKLRIANILNYKKPAFWVCVMSTVCAISLGVFCLTSPLPTTPITSTSAPESNSSSNLTPPFAQDDVLHPNGIVPATATATPAPTATPENNETEEPLATSTPLPITTPAPESTALPIPTPALESENTDAQADSTSTQHSSSSANATTLSLLWPVPDYTYVSRWQIAENNDDSTTAHDGVDIVADGGTAIYAMADGVVITAAYTPCTPENIVSPHIGDGTGYGYGIVVDHGDGLYTFYAHCKMLHVAVGDVVSQGDLIAEVGSTGWSTGNHCHMEIWNNGTTIAPQTLFSANDFASSAP